MIAALVVLLWGARMQSGQSSLAEIIEASRRGELARSWSAIEHLDDPLARSQARLYVLARAGDLDGALAAGLESLRAHPTDPWLCERVTALAYSLRRGALAAGELVQLRVALQTVDPVEAQRWRAALHERETEVTELLDLEQRARAAGMRSRGAVAGIAGLALACAASLLVQAKRNRPVEAWARQGG